MIDLNELKRLAQAAMDEAPNPGHERCLPPARAALIAAANPQAVLELIERCERAEEESRSARELAQRLQWDLDTRTAEMLALSERVRELAAISLCRFEGGTK